MRYCSSRHGVFFVQVAQRDNYHRYYARLQEALQVHPLYEEVSSAVREMYEYMKVRRTERIEKRMLLFTLFYPGVTPL